MVDKRILLKLLVLLSAIANTPSAIPAQEPNQTTPADPSTTPCAFTQPVRAEPPRDPNADRLSVGPWYINNDQTIGAGWNVGEWVSGGTGNKVMWIRPQATQLRITGRRLDAAAPPLKGSHPLLLYHRIPADTAILSERRLLGGDRDVRRQHFDLHGKH